MENKVLTQNLEQSLARTYRNASGILESCTLALAVGLKQAYGRKFLKCYLMTVTILS